MVDALEQVLTSRTRAADLVSKGKQQAGKFTWEKAGQTTLEAFRRVLG